jgi:hypothetical protein
MISEADLSRLIFKTRTSLFAKRTLQGNPLSGVLVTLEGPSCGEKRSGT